jgi:lysyl endopeptidase
MRRSVGVLVGALTVLTVAGAAGVTASAFPDEGRPVGTWQGAPGVPRTPAAVVRASTPVPPPSAPPAAPAAAQAERRAAAKAPVIAQAAPRTESVEAPSGRQRVGTLKKITKTVGYARTTEKQTFRYPGASYVKLHFSRVALLPGDYVTVSDAAGTEAYRYEAPAVGAAAPTGRWAMSVDGDTAVLELHRGAVGRLGPALGVTVDKVARGNSPTEQQQADTAAVEPTAPGRTGREESICAGDQSRDAVCYRSADPVAYTRSKGIARLLINGTELCTGWRLGPKNRMLTNNHCFDNSDDAYETEVWFNYQCAVCGAPATLRPTKVWGDRVLATNRTYDYTLFTVEQFSRVKDFGYLALDTRRPNRNEALYVPQHPAGEPTRIAGAKGEAAGNCKVVDREYDGYARDSDVSYYCDTEGGSSGSPVLSRVTNKVVALHHFGGCPNSGVRGDLILSKIKNLI